MKRALILDDEPICLQVCAAILASRHFTVVTVSNAADAIRTCQETSFDLLVADVELPASSGPNVAVEIHTCCPMMAILFISGTAIEGWRRTDVDDSRRLFQARVDFLQKPFTVMTMMHRVEHLLSGTSPLSDFRALVDQSDTQMLDARHT